MPIPRPRLRPPAWLRLPRRPARLRLTVLYGAAFVACGACGAAVLAVTYLLYGHLTTRLHQHLTIHVHAHGHQTHLAHLPKPQTSSGLYEVFKVPSAAVQRAGPYDVLKLPIAAVRQANDAIPAVQQANMTIHVAGLGQITFDRQQMLIASAIVLAAFVVAAAAIGWVLAGRVLRPLSTITAAARRISASSLHERLALPGPDDELKELADTLDGLFARLEASFDAQRRFAASASHELRTPLTREHTLLQVTLADPASTLDTWPLLGRSSAQ